MKLFLKQNTRIIIFSCVGVLFLILALCLKLESSDFFTLIYLPLQAIGDYIRYNLGNSFGGWALYIFLGILPLVYPVAKMIIKRKFYWVSIAWLALSIFDYIMLYFFINPHFLNNKLIQSSGAFNRTTLIGFEVTFFILFFICVLLELGIQLKTKPWKSYFLGKVAIDALILVFIFKFFFTDILTAKLNFDNISAASPALANFNKGLNRFAVVFSLLTKFASTAFTVLLLNKCCRFIDRLRGNPLNPDNMNALKSLIGFAKLTVIITLGMTALDNIFNIALSTTLLNVVYNIEIPIVTLIIICLVIIFSEILMRAIKLNEEQKLVI